MNRKASLVVFVVIAMLLTATAASADKPVQYDAQGTETGWTANAPGCATIQDGTILDSAGNPLTVGFDQYGYNYQAHMFNGYYDNYSRQTVPVAEGDSLVMKWNDAWLANVDCDGDGKLDRHYGYPTYKGSGAWVTNHGMGTYIDDAGQTCKWEYFVKIVAAPDDATSVNGTWYTADGISIGPVIWGEFAITQEVSNDPCLGEHGLLYLSPDHAGLSGW